MLIVFVVFAAFVAVSIESYGVKLANSHIWYHQRKKIHNPSETIPSGLCCIYKPKGWSTHETAKKVKYILQNELKFIYEFKKPRIKVSHFERKLDRNAQGVLLLAVGAAIPLMYPKYMDGESAFRVDGYFGTSEDGEDDEGRETSVMDQQVTSRDIERILPKFRGTIVHQPPFQYLGMQMDQETIDYINGGVWPELQPYNIHISRLELVEKTKTNAMPYFNLKMKCDRNTYPRTIIEDMAKMLKTTSNINSVTRFMQSGFSVWNSLDITRCNYEQLKENIVRTSKKAGMDISELVPAEKYRMRVMRSANMQQRNRLKKEEQMWLLAHGEGAAEGGAVGAGSGLDQTGPEPSFFDLLDFKPKRITPGTSSQSIGSSDKRNDESLKNSVVSIDPSDVVEVIDDADVIVREEDPSTMEITDEL